MRNTRAISLAISGFVLFGPVFAAATGVSPASQGKGVMQDGILLDTKFNFVHNGIAFEDSEKVILPGVSDNWTLLSQSPQGIRLYARSEKVEGDTVLIGYQVVDPQGKVLSSPRINTMTGIQASIEGKSDNGTDDTHIESRLSKVRYQLE